MLGASDWLLVGTHGRRFEQDGPAFIERTLDGGRHWSMVFSAPHDELWWVGRDGTSVMVAGDISPGREADGSEIAPLPLLLQSSNGGASFRVIHPRVPPRAGWRTLDQFAFSGHGAALAVNKLAYPGVLRSADDGVTWRLVPLPGEGVADGSATWTPDGREAFVTGEAEEKSLSARCRNALWRSTDAGASWQRVRGACRYFNAHGPVAQELARRGGGVEPPYGVAFLDSQHGFISSGSDPKFRPGEVVYATDDGGEHWHVAWRVRAGSPIVQLQFVDREHGWALPGYTSSGANFPDLGDALSTSDGGEHWQDTGQLASALSALPSGSALALVSNRYYRAPELALTRDDGAHWTQLTALPDVRTEALLGGAGTVSDVTDAGAFVSSDGGEHWSQFDPPQLGTLLAAQPGMTATLHASRDHCALLLSSNGGTEWRAVAPPGGTRIGVPETGVICPEESIAFASPTRGLAAAMLDGGSCDPPNAQSESHLYTTSDGGQHWQVQQAVSLNSASDAAVAASGDTYATVTDAEGGVDERHCDRIAISRDSGRSWTIQAFPASQECSGVAAYASEIWVTCDVARTERTHSVVYHSTDRGRTWHTYTGTSDAFSPSQIVATGPGSAIATNNPEGPTEPEGPSLWRTSDGGATWTQSWPALPIGPASKPTGGHLRA
jgi:photosystem II stability/assembly factor-like uncharacterized protein